MCSAKKCHLKYVGVLISKPCKCYLQRDISDVIKLRTLRWEDYPGSSAWTWYNRKGPCNGKQEIGVSNRRCDNGSKMFKWFKKGPKAKEIRQSVEADKGKIWKPPEGVQPTNTLILDFWPVELHGNRSVVLIQLVLGTLLQWQWETNTWNNLDKRKSHH